MAARNTRAGLVLTACASVATGQQPFVANLLAYGGKPDGTTLNTAAFASAIAAVAAHDGGVLYVPSGTWLTGPMNLTSGLELLLDNATILATADFADWAIVSPLPSYGRGRDFPGPRYEALMSCYNCSSLKISSNSTGTIDGQGEIWWDAVKGGTLNVTPGHLVETLWSDSVEIGGGLTFVDSPFWNLHLWSSNNVWVHDVAVRAPIHSTNTDGIDPDSAQNVTIERVDVRNGDDCIAIKAGWGSWGVDYGVPTRNVTIRDMYCETQSACLAIGSEMSGSVLGVRAYNITCGAAGQGVNVKSTLGRGGVVADVVVDGLNIVGPVGCAMAVTDAYTDQYPPAPVDPRLVPTFANITIANLFTSGNGQIVGHTAGDFNGLNQTQPAGVPSGFITGLRLVNVSLPSNARWSCRNVTGTAENVSPKPCDALLPANV